MKACDICGTEHGEKQAHRFPRMSHAEVYRVVTHDNQPVTDGRRMTVTASDPDPQTPAQRRAKWRKAHPEKHAEQQRKHRKSAPSLSPKNNSVV